MQNGCGSFGMNPHSKWHSTSNCINENNTHGKNYKPKNNNGNVVIVVQPKMSGHSGGGRVVGLAHSGGGRVVGLAHSGGGHVVGLAHSGGGRVLMNSKITVNNGDRYDTSSIYQGPEDRNDTSMKFCFSCNTRKLHVCRYGSLCCNTCGC